MRSDATGPTLGQLLLGLAVATLLVIAGDWHGRVAARHAMPLACLVDSSATGAP